VKTGDIVTYCNPNSSEVETVLLIDTGYDCATEFGAMEEEAVRIGHIMNENVNRWVPFEYLYGLDVILSELDL
jgi:hypothetical protein